MPLLLVSLSVFVATALLYLAASSSFSRRERLRRRFSGLQPGWTTGQGRGSEPTRQRIDPARLGLSAGAERNLRAALIKAGLFQPHAPKTFTLVRFALLLALPATGLLATAFAPASWGIAETAALVATLFAIAYVLPGAYLSRRARGLQTKYRVGFPDFLDMLVVCINAGLSLEAALDRTARELGPDDAEFRANLDLMGAEMRAGKSTSDALRALADRLGLREARSFAGLMKQTMELGTDVSRALTIFADEMRSRRMTSAEEKAAALPPKLTVPLALFIFPVVLIAVLAPAVVRITALSAP